MKVKFAKLIVLALVLALTLSGCSLFGYDYEGMADKQIKKINKDYKKAVARYDGGEVTMSEVVNEFYATYNTMSYYAQMYGYEMTQEDARFYMQEAMEYRVRAEIAAAKFDAQHSLSEEELAAVAEEAQHSHETNYEGLMANAAGNTDEQREQNARVLLHTMGLDYDSIYNSLLAVTKMGKMEQLLGEEVGSVDEADLQAKYDEKLAEQQASFTDGYSFESAMSNGNEVICWRPDGYRTVKHILLIPSDEAMAAYKEAAAGEDAAALEAAKQACLAEVQPKLDEIYAKLEAGESFESLIEAYGEDPGMQNEPTKTSGYFVSSQSVQWESNFQQAAMALNQVGEYTEPVVGASGVHIIQFTSDVLGGSVPFADVKDALYAEALADARTDHAKQIVDEWVAAANPTYDVEAFEKLLTSA